MNTKPASRILANIDSVLATLKKRGFKLGSPWWRELLAKFYGGGWKRLVLRVGRRGGKSKIGEFIAVLEMLFGDHAIPAGDVGWFAFISVNRDEASQRIRNIKSMLDALGVAYTATADSIELTDRNRGAKVLTASVMGAVGWTLIGIWFDEMARARDDKSGANPAAEVLENLTPSTATQLAARVFLSSSPLSTVDAHAAAFDLGTTDYQLTAAAPTWVANDTLTEDDCRRLAPTEREFRREYAAIPQASVGAAFEEGAIDAAESLVVDGSGWEPSEHFVITDQSSGRNDAWVWMVCRFVTDVFEVVSIDALEGSFFRQVSAEKAIERLATAAKAVGARHVFGDQREAYALDSLFSKAGLSFTSIAWTNQLKVDAVERLRAWLRDRKISIPRHERLRAELLSFEERFTPSGALTYAGRKSHDDCVACLLTGAMAESMNMLPIARRAGQQNPDWGKYQPDSRWTITDPDHPDYGLPQRGY